MDRQEAPSHLRYSPFTPRSHSNRQHLRPLNQLRDFDVLVRAVRVVADWGEERAGDAGFGQPGDVGDSDEAADERRAAADELRGPDDGLHAGVSLK